MRLTQVYLEEDQIRTLRRLARRRGTPVSALIREAVRRFLEDPQNSLEPWEEELRFMDRWASGPPAIRAPDEVLRTSSGTRGPGREWRREDLHERRPD
jgi:hypothetical protein